MQRRIGKGAVGTVMVWVIAMLAVPPPSRAAEQCLYQGEPVSGAAERAERSLLCLTNVHRVRSGAPPLVLDTRLAIAAGAHSSDMVARNFFDHQTPEGTGPSERAAAVGFPGGAAENIAATGAGGTALLMFQVWRGSPGHNQNMLAPAYRSAGMGLVRGVPGSPGTGTTGTQMFGLVAGDTGDTALDLYASSDACAAAKLTVERLLTKRAGKKASKKKASNKKKAAAKRKLKQARKRVSSLCRAP